MREIKLKLSEQICREIESRCDALGMDVEGFLEERIPRSLDDMVLRTHTAWVSREKWRDLVDGRDCPICRDLSSDDAYGAGDFVVERLEAGVLTLSPNQSVPGYCVLWCGRHAAEPYALEPEFQLKYFEGLMAAARAIASVYRPDKLNYQVLGNLVPHLHCHLIPRYYGDRAPAEPIHPDGAPLFLEPEAYREKIQALRAALAADQR